MLNCLVTGGTGQIGTFLCEELARRGTDVVCYDAREGASSGGSKSFVGDVTDAERLRGVSKDNAIDCIIHLAASLVLESREHPALSYRTNIIGTNNVLEVAKSLEVRKVVIASSVAVYGLPKSRRRGMVDEDDTLEVPSDPYSTSKAACELMGRFYRDSYGMDVTCLRLAGAWGPGRYTGYTGQFNDFLRRAALGGEVDVPEDFAYEDAKLRWMYVKDVAKCFADVAASRKTKSYLYNAGSRRPFNSVDVVNALSDVLKDAQVSLRLRKTPTATSKTVAGPNGLDVDCGKLYREFGFRQAFDLKEAVRDTVDIERSKPDQRASG